MAVDISETSEQFALNDESLSALRDLASDAENEPKRMEAIAAITVDSKYAVVIKVGSYGVDTKKDNEEFWVDGVFFSPQFGELAYRGKHISQKKKAEQENWRHGATSVIVSVKAVEPLDGVSEIAYYDYETGEVLAAIPQEGEF